MCNPASCAYAYCLAFGSNLGRRADAVREAVRRVSKLEDTTVSSVSSFIETKPEGMPPGARKVINCCAVANSALEPLEFKRALKRIEEAMGEGGAKRINGMYAPRRIDIDLILCGALIFNKDGLILPHPRFHERRYVLEPLSEIAPDAIHPVFQQTIAQLLKQCLAGQGGGQSARAQEPSLFLSALRAESSTLEGQTRPFLSSSD